MMDDSLPIIPLDSLDHQIVTILRQDARVTNREIAAQLGAAESTISMHIRNLSQRNVFRIVAMHDVRSLGYDILAYMTITVQERDLTAVADDLAKIDAVAAVAIGAGMPHIVISVVARNRDDLSRLIVCTIARIPGIYHLETLISLRICKFISEWALLGASLPSIVSDDDTDVKSRILRIVEQDARLSNREIARQLSLSEASVRKWLKVLLGDGAMKFGAMIDPRALGLDCSAMIRIKAQPAFIGPIVDEIVRYEDFNFVSVTSGAYDILANATVQNRQKLATLVNDQLSRLRGVIGAEVIEHNQVVKMRYNLVRIFPTQDDAV